MDISSSCNAASAASAAAAAAAAATVKTPEAESESPATGRIYPAKPLSYSTNGVLKRLNNLRRRHHHAVVVNYRECLKNHAAALGGHAVDGCGEFMPTPAANPADPTSLKCAACGCHRNFHRREPSEEILPPPDPVPALEYRPYNRHHPPTPRDGGYHSSPDSPSSPPPISSAYYPSATHVLLSLSTGPQNDKNTPISGTPASNPNGKKRFRTKFTHNQKEKMSEFAEKVGWKIQKRDEDLINELCREIGVERGVLKVWMHNNKNTSGKKDHGAATNTAATAAADNVQGIDFDIVSTKSHNLDTQFDIKKENNGHNVSSPVAATNGSFYSF